MKSLMRDQKNSHFRTFYEIIKIYHSIFSIESDDPVHFALANYYQGYHTATVPP